MSGWAPRDAVMEANGEKPFTNAADEALDDLMEHMEKMTQRQRVVVFQYLGDFFCPRCGIEQPPGDCRCGRG